MHKSSLNCKHEGTFSLYKDNGYIKLIDYWQFYELGKLMEETDNYIRYEIKPVLLKDRLTNLINQKISGTFFFNKKTKIAYVDSKRYSETDSHEIGIQWNFYKYSVKYQCTKP